MCRRVTEKRELRIRKLPFRGEDSYIVPSKHVGGHVEFVQPKKSTSKSHFPAKPIWT